MRVIGIDLSLTATGYADEHGTQIWKPKHIGIERLDHLRSLVLLCCFDDATSLVVLEGYSMGGQRGSAGIGQALGELGGLIRWSLWNEAIPYVDVPPASLKKFATGKGNAPKDAVLTAAVRAGSDANDNNAADAWWLRQMGLYRFGVADVPQTQYRDEAVAKVTWPALLTDDQTAKQATA